MACTARSLKRPCKVVLFVKVQTAFFARTGVGMQRFWGDVCVCFSVQLEVLFTTPRFDPIELRYFREGLEGQDVSTEVHVGENSFLCHTNALSAILHARVGWLASGQKRVSLRTSLTCPMSPGGGTHSQPDVYWVAVLVANNLRAPGPLFLHHLSLDLTVAG